MKIFENKLIFIFLYAALAFGVIYTMTSAGLGVSTDSESYLVGANRFTQQRWGESFNPIWPPLYPLSIAAIKATGLAGLLGAARIISIFTFIISIVTVYLIGLQLKGRVTAHLSVISALILGSLVYLYCFCWSETLYIMLSLLFFLMLTLFLNTPPKKSTQYIIFGGIFAGLGTITRYIGFSLIGTGVLSILFLSDYQPRIAKLKKTLLFILVSGIPVLLHYLSCFYYYGLRGKTQFPSPYSFSHQLLQFPITFYHDLLTLDLMFWKYTFLFDWRLPFYWLRAAVLISLFIFLFLFLKTIFTAPPRKDEFRIPISVIIYLVLYTSIILITGSAIAIDPIGSRFTVPMYPLLLLLVYFVMAHVFKAFAPGKYRIWLISVMILSTAIFCSIQLASTLSIYKGISTGSFPALEHPGNLNRASLKFLMKNAESNDYIISNVYRKLTFIWPRQEPYPNITRDEWEKSLNAVTYEASLRTVYILICTEDPSPLGITVEDMERTYDKTGLFSWKKILGSDYLYKTKQVVMQPPRESK